MRLIDADTLKKALHMGDECEECEQDTRQCQYDAIFSRMDICSMLDGALTVATDINVPDKSEDDRISAVKPEIYGNWWYRCGVCKRALSPGDKYCKECGRKVLWDAAD